MPVYFSFDDGRLDTFLTGYRILRGYGFTASIHVTTGFVDGSFKTNAFGDGAKSISYENCYEMFKNGFDISSHGDKHQMNDFDFKESVQKLSKWGIACNRIGFSVPNSAYKMYELDSFVGNNIDSLAYVRVGRCPKCYSFINKINYILYRITKCFCFYDLFNRNNVINNNDRYKIYSVVILNDTSLKSLEKFIRKYSKLNIVLMFHSISTKKDKWHWNVNSFKQLCEFLKKENIKVLNLLEFR